jgi:hypothetical protein
MEGGAVDGLGGGAGGDSATVGVVGGLAAGVPAEQAALPETAATVASPAAQWRNLRMDAP